MSNAICIMKNFRCKTTLCGSRDTSNATNTSTAGTSPRMCPGCVGSKYFQSVLSSREETRQAIVAARNAS